MINIRGNRYRQSSKEEFFLKKMKKVINCCKEYCMQTSIHGFNHIAAPRRHWIERLLWIMVTGMAVWGVIDVSLGQWQRYIENPTVVTLEKDFRTWRLNIPAVTACAKNRVSKEKLPEAIKSRWNIQESDPKYKYYEKFVLTVANSDLFNLNNYKEFKDDPALEVNLYELVLEVLSDHRIKMRSSEAVNHKWIPVMTESGCCYTINSIAVADVVLMNLDENNTINVPTTCKYSSQGCYIMFESTVIYHYYIHSPYDVVNVMSKPSTVFPTLNRYVEFSSMETRTGVGVRSLSPRTRHCFYTDEPTIPSRKVYSTNTCRQNCRSRLAQKLCGCNPFYYFYDGGPQCTPAGMWCLAAYNQTLANFNGIKCSCKQQCLDSVYREISSDDQIWDKGPFQTHGAVRFTVQAPRTRYTRHIVFHLQDLIVSFGGAAGLFLGASFISFVEIGYFVIEKIFYSRHPEPTVVYSTNTCRQNCRSRLAQKLCGCNPFYYFYDGGPQCTPAGMWCLAAYNQTLANFNGIKCSCKQQCLDSVYREISSDDQIWDKGPFQTHGAVRFTVQAPRTRYTRHIVFHLQDLIVSFGGAAGLFLGASFISFVEIGYFVIEKIFYSRHPEPTVVKKTSMPYEARIKEINFILEECFRE